jgi:hypothetical protein
LAYIVDAEGSGQDGAWEVKCREGIPAEQEAVRGACIIIVDPHNLAGVIDPEQVSKRAVWEVNGDETAPAK